MNRLIYILIFFFLISKPVISQNQANNWYLGDNCIVTFNTRNKEPKNLNIHNFCVVNDLNACISDKYGNFLFTTDPNNYICNKFYNRINKEYFLGIYIPSIIAQRSVFIPKPGSDSLVYLFVSSGDVFSYGLRYFLLDTKRNNDSADFVKYFVFLGQSFSTKIAATNHENGHDIWVVTHEWNSNSFRSYLISDKIEDSIDTFISSKAGLIFSGDASYDNGFMKISPNGKSIAYQYSPLYSQGSMMLFSFDNRTGKVSNPIRIPHNKYDKPNYLEFSPDGSKLYTIEGLPGVQGKRRKIIVQYDANSTDSLSLINSKKIVSFADTSASYIGSLQLAPNKKIYFSLYSWNKEDGTEDRSFLGAIQYPNAEGRNCLVVDSSFRMLYNLLNPILQNYISSYFWDSCDVASFYYPFFKYSDGLIINGSAKKRDITMRLTNNERYQTGAFWYKRQVPVSSSFELTYSFRMFGGTNRNSEDNSEPGADGIALVFKNSDDTLGTTGGGIGYNGIRNALAIEIDLYKNENNYDISGNHIAVQCSKNKISSQHDSKYTISLKDIPFKIKSDSTIYFCKISYYSDKKRLKIYLDSSENFDYPILILDSFDLSLLLDLKNSKYATIGFTSATGDASQFHEIINWRFCSKEYLDNFITNINYNLLNDETFTSIITPNPATDYIEIQVDDRTLKDAVIKVYNVLGLEVLSASYTPPDPLSRGGNVRIDVSALPAGVYFVRVGDKMYKFMKI